MPTLSNHTQLPGFHPVAEHARFHVFVRPEEPVHLRVEDYLNGDPFFDTIDGEGE